MHQDSVGAEDGGSCENNQGSMVCYMAHNSESAEDDDGYE